MTGPAANKSPEDQGCEDSGRKKDKTGIERSGLDRMHRFRWLDRRYGASGYPPLNEMHDHKQCQHN